MYVPAHMHARTHARTHTQWASGRHATQPAQSTGQLLILTVKDTLHLQQTKCGRLLIGQDGLSHTDTHTHLSPPGSTWGGGGML